MKSSVIGDFERLANGRRLRVLRRACASSKRLTLRLRRLRTRYTDRFAQSRQVSKATRAFAKEKRGQSVLIQLEESLRWGALDTAAELAGQLQSELPRENIVVYRRGLFAVLRTLFGIGAIEQAARLAWQHQAVLAGTIFDARTIELDKVDIVAEPQSCILADGSLNTFLLSHLVAAEKLSADSLVDYVRAFMHHYLCSPQIELLLASSYHLQDVASIALPLNRFLNWYRLPRLRSEVATANVLAGLSFTRTAHETSTTSETVSVIMSAYRARSTIGYSVASILSQSHRRLELLVADDGSDDDTLDYLAARFGHDPRLRLFRSSVNQGTYNVRNQLIERARGSFITFQDADDVSLPNRIAAQLNCLRATAGSACVADWVRVKPDGQFVFFRDQSATRLSVVSLMIRREVLSLVGRYRSAKFGADLEFLERLKYLVGPGRVARIRQPLLFGLWAKKSMTRQAGREALEDGYRAPARRVYGELLWLQHQHGWSSNVDEHVLMRLLETDNVQSASQLIAFS